MSQKRPECMRILELLPPYAEEDVRRAYRARAKAAHPDSGGSAEQLQAVRAAYKQALEYLEFRGDRRRWMSLQVERYRQTQEVIRLVEHLQGEVEVEAEGWRRESLGDFAQLSERILTIRLNRPSHTSQSLEEIVRFPEAIESVRLLDLGDSRIDDDAIAPVLQFSRLLQLDVRGTKLSHAGIRNLIRSLKHLEAINVHGTPYGLLSQWRQRISRRRPRCLASPTRPFNAAPPEHRDLMGIPPLS